VAYETFHGQWRDHCVQRGDFFRGLRFSDWQDPFKAFVGPRLDERAINIEEDETRALNIFGGARFSLVARWAFACRRRSSGCGGLFRQRGPMVSTPCRRISDFNVSQRKLVRL
jgi:hypothetical protein